ncbi:hypothetical protein HMJ29_18565 [Hymenobacter taeanensis]|uniref:Uncharacterized protein n=1 Tax=Hymenobacter taeanensis TaxID=2735321 RepID=A0A6M6BLV4_9BACT|nr:MULTISPECIES: hypothetical protein [Hymenobacter]QJX48808.1 hypothetical protein HMJ29_18565 [Hymenobacter taeanensis]UOQ81684.1 hypothetical protein MUN83_02505 [Hymenobacter sp. 5414T-23]
MENLLSFALILLGLGFVIWRLVQKANATTQREKQERRFSKPDSAGKPRPVMPLPATSFEEMLKQMQAQNQAETNQAPRKSEQTTPAGRPLPREVAPTPYSQEKTDIPVRSLERTVSNRSLEVPAHEARRASTLPRAAARPTDPTDYWQRQAARRADALRPAPARNLNDLLRNPADLRNAFILSEILKRKF